MYGIAILEDDLVVYYLSQHIFTKQNRNTVSYLLKRNKTHSPSWQSIKYLLARERISHGVVKRKLGVRQHNRRNVKPCAE
jgi:hypothetical protein